MAIKPFQSTGLLGERDVTKKLLELPIPTFDHESEAHRKLATLGKQCRTKSEAAVHSCEFATETSVARQRASIRAHLETEMEEINKLVITLLKGQAAGAS